MKFNLKKEKQCKLVMFLKKEKCYMVKIWFQYSKGSFKETGELKILNKRHDPESLMFCKRASIQNLNVICKNRNSNQN